MKFNLVKTVGDFLTGNPEQKFTVREIADWIFKNFPDECEEKKLRSTSIKTDAELLDQIRRELAAHRPRLQQHYPQVKRTEERPFRYYWTEKPDQVAADEAEAWRGGAKVVLDDVPAPAPLAQGRRTTKRKRDSGDGVSKESDLYPIVSEYLWSKLNIYSKRIDEKKSSNRQGAKGNKWLYPDLVGMEDLTVGWHHEIKNVVDKYASKKANLWSFEVKNILNRSNLRESFFQTVSNSSWANFGYLVAAKIEKGDTMKELRMLFSLHGIGLIEIDSGNPTESQILVPARERHDIDWATCDRLTHENKDFRRYINLVHQFHLTGEPRPDDWDIPKGR